MKIGKLFFNLLLAHNGDPKTSKEEVKQETGISLKDIFLSDYENITLFIDFQAVTDDVNELNVKKGGKLVMIDDVSDLPNSSIYEINLDVLSAGQYTIELKTAEGISIQKEIMIK